MLAKYAQGSPFLAIKEAFRGHDWLPWMFTDPHAALPRGHWDSVEEQRRFFEYLEQKLELEASTDAGTGTGTASSSSSSSDEGKRCWYDVVPSRVTQFSKLAKYIIRHYYGGSFTKALSTVFPVLLPWRFKHAPVPVGYWHHIDHQRAFLVWFYASSSSSATASALSSPPQLPPSVQTPRRRPHHHQVVDLSWWYHVRVEQVVKAGGAGMLSQHKNSLFSVLRTAYPHHAWDPLRFPRTSRGDRVADNITMQRQLLDQFAKLLSPSFKLQDWYGITGAAVEKLERGQELLKHYDGSLVAALQAAYPEHLWQVWRFKQAPRNFWTNMDHHKMFLDWATKQLEQDQTQKHEQPQEQEQEQSSTSSSLLPLHLWYRAKISDVDALGGGAMLTGHYGGSLMRALMENYPSHNWQPWRFSKVPHEFWNSVDQLRAYINEIASVFKIQPDSIEDWYRISVTQLQEAGLKSPPVRVGGLYGVLLRVYPAHKWEPRRFSLTSKRSTQRQLRITLQEIVGPKHLILEEFELPEPEPEPEPRPEPELEPEPGSPANASNILQQQQQQQRRRRRQTDATRLDLYIPTLRVGFEYQGEQHIRDVHAVTQAQLQDRRDADKAARCASAGITLVTIPPSWDKSQEALRTIIRTQHPTLPLR